MLITRATVEQLSGLFACNPRAEQDTFAPAAFVWWLVQQAGLDVFVHARETDKRKCHFSNVICFTVGQSPFKERQISKTLSDR